MIICLYLASASIVFSHCYYLLITYSVTGEPNSVVGSPAVSSSLQRKASSGLLSSTYIFILVKVPDWPT